MRIIAGVNKGHKLLTLPGLSTRPMMDRMKEAIFNIIGPFFSDGTILDLFGGSGALSLEALSRGNKLSYIVEKAPAAIKVIEQNIKNLKQENNIKIFKCDYKIALKKLSKENIKFDLVFIDPPYKLNVIDQIIDYLLQNDMLDIDAFIICHYSKGNYNVQEINDFNLVKSFSYSSNEVCIYQMIKC